MNKCKHFNGGWCNLFSNDWCDALCSEGSDDCPYKVSVNTTNYDRLISKSAEEMAEFFAVCGTSRFYMRCDAEAVMEEKWRWLDWLNQEVKDED